MSSQHYLTDPYDLANEDENHSGKDCNKTYRYGPTASQKGQKAPVVLCIPIGM
jgi:hypothetical protein